MKRRRRKLPMPTFEQYETCLADAQHDQDKALRAIFNFDDFNVKNMKTMSQLEAFWEQRQSHKPSNRP